MTETAARLLGLLGFVTFFGMIFSFLSITVWTEARRKEREAYYRSETVKKLTESPAAAAMVIEFTREQERNAMRRMHDGIRLAGLIVFFAGIGVMIFLRNLVPARPVYLAGLIPMAVGAALLVHGYILVRRE